MPHTCPERNRYFNRNTTRHLAQICHSIEQFMIMTKQQPNHPPLPPPHHAKSKTLRYANPYNQSVHLAALQGAPLGQQCFLFIVCSAEVHFSYVDVDGSCSLSAVSICRIRNQQLQAGLPRGDSLIIAVPDQRNARGYVFGTILLCLPKQLTCLLPLCHSYLRIFFLKTKPRNFLAVKSKIYVYVYRTT